MADKAMKKKEPEIKRRRGLDLNPDTKRTIWGIVSLGLALVTGFSFFGQAGKVGSLFYEAAEEAFGAGAFILPLLFLAGAIILLRERRERRVSLRVLVSGSVFFAALLTLLELLFRDRAMGGAIGGALSIPTEYLFGLWAGYVFWGAAFVISLFMFFNTSSLSYRFRPADEGGDLSDAAPEQSEASSVAIAPSSAVPLRAPAPSGGQPSPAADTLGQKIGRALKPRFLFTKVDSKIKENEEKTSQSPKSAPAAAVSARTNPGSVYERPPLKLLEGGTSEPTPGDVELHSRMIQKTLENFGIGVEMSEVNVGPTVSQFTLKPAEGVKLSRIVGLQNDLALALAAHPLRIEAPIPGRSLVGIEIPNKAVALVRLKSLLEEPEVVEATQPLSFVLGRDVTGRPAFDSITRMPHLLIAGSTGSGKSIAIHSLLTNLLFRHGPEELQLLMVDPKRVELISYNGIPQLLAPVIMEPKKTVTALAWAIGEMDRRYQLLSQYGVRDIASFHARKERLPYIVIVIDELADIMASFGREVEAAIVRLAQMARAVGIHLVVSTQRPSIEVITGLIKANITARMAFQVASQIDSRTILDMAGAEKLLGAGDMLFLKGDGSKPRRIQGAYVSEEEVRRVTDWLKKDSPPRIELASARRGGAEEGRMTDDASARRGGAEEGRMADDASAPQGLMRTENESADDDKDRAFSAGRPGGRASPPAGGSNGWAPPVFQDPPAGPVRSPFMALPSSVSFGRDNGSDSVDEPLYEDARRAVVEAKRASASLLQRRLRVGYARAARLMDILEERGVIGPGDGAKAREILTHEQDDPFA
jgi:S-DNA-T family DNA segregation ATPase FtsK/SpoIIIE